MSVNSSTLGAVRRRTFIGRVIRHSEGKQLRHTAKIRDEREKPSDSPQKPQSSQATVSVKKTISNGSLGKRAGRERRRSMRGKASDKGAQICKEVASAGEHVDTVGGPPYICRFDPSNDARGPAGRRRQSRSALLGAFRRPRRLARHVDCQEKSWWERCGQGSNESKCRRLSLVWSRESGQCLWL